MRTIMENPGTLYLGKQGENLARKIPFREPAIWAREFGEGVAQLLVSPPGCGKTYPVILDQEDGLAVWTVTAADTARAGWGRCELRWSINGQVVRSQAYTTYVAESLSGWDRHCACGPTTGPGSLRPPGCGDDNWGRYLEEITRAGAEAMAAASRVENAAYHAPAIINGNWWIWDLDASGYKDTGVPATGEATIDGVEIAGDEDVSEMLDEVFGPHEQIHDNKMEE